MHDERAHYVHAAGLRPSGPVNLMTREGCLRTLVAGADCYLCFTWEDPSGLLPEEVREGENT